jgi:hypothetical protein
MKPPPLTIGIEDEYQIIDPKTRELCSDNTPVEDPKRTGTLLRIAGLVVFILVIGVHSLFR